jgi:hypothetical protein
MKRFILSILLALSIISTTGAANLGFLTAPQLMFWNSTGSALLISGQVVTCQPGTTCGCTSFTPITTYTDSTGVTPNTNPIVLNSSGGASIWYSGLAKITLCDMNNVLQWTVDNVPAVLYQSSVSNEWVSLPLLNALASVSPTYLSSVTFSVPTDYTSIFTQGRRLQVTETGGIYYATVSGAVYAGGITTVTVINDNTVLNSGLSTVNIGLMNPAYPSTPIRPVTTRTTNYAIQPSDCGGSIISNGINTTVTMTIASPGVFSTGSAHGLTTGSPVVFTTTGILPDNINTYPTASYYVINSGLTSTQFEVSTTPSGTGVSTSAEVCSITTATPAVISVSAGHNFNVFDPVQFTTTGSLPVGMSTGSTYYIGNTGLTSTQFQITTAPTNTTYINTTSGGSGTQSVARVISGTDSVISYPSFTLSSSVPSGCAITMKNIGMGTFLVGSVDGIVNPFLYSGEEIQLLFDGVAWRGLRGSYPSGPGTIGEQFVQYQIYAPGPSITFPWVTVGDRIIAFVTVADTYSVAPTTQLCTFNINSGGTATAIVNGVPGLIGVPLPQATGAGTTYGLSTAIIVNVTASGSLNIGYGCLWSGGTFSAYNRYLYTFFLKKQ